MVPRGLCQNGAKSRCGNGESPYRFDTMNGVTSMHEHFPESTRLDGGLMIRPVDPNDDSSMIYEWTRAERARFWGMGWATQNDIRDIYYALAASETHHAYVLSWEGRACAIFQTYDPRSDEVGQFYPVDNHDLGFHLMLGPRDVFSTSAPRSRAVRRVIEGLAPEVILRTGARRLLADPDSNNERAIQRLHSIGFTTMSRVWLPGQAKQAELMIHDDARQFCTPYGI
ncbi:siderophore biosynthesis protein [Corynebacterium heidelbergense]|uniref:Lysine N-acyltransferase MbtK n=2 Tax=Corynebacterium heidelbergense TaxID=2055947 RepID=A0A364VB10_9CORY|nr:siderophore biosynthesis protein [Corynebacterium heidelbergense]